MKRNALFIALTVSMSMIGFAQNLDMGTTYEILDAQALRVTTEFNDAYAVTVRLDNGNLETQLFTDSPTLPTVELTYLFGEKILMLDGAQTLKIANSRELYLTADWANAQAYNLWRDQYSLGNTPLKSENLQWKGDFVRPEGIRESGNRALGNIQTVVTEFENSIAISQNVEKGNYLWEPQSNKKNPATPTFQTLIQDATSGQTLGRIQWDRKSQTLLWDFPEGTTAGINEKVLPDGWTFEPNPAWANIQAKGFVDFFARNKAALRNDPGCDGLHWLDGTIFRLCCDLHDLCYEYFGCTAKSWFFQGKWQCILCNGGVVVCFAAIIVAIL